MQSSEQHICPEDKEFEKPNNCQKNSYNTNQIDDVELFGRNARRGLVVCFYNFCCHRSDYIAIRIDKPTLLVADHLERKVNNKNDSALEDIYMSNNATDSLLVLQFMTVSLNI